MKIEDFVGIPFKDEGRDFKGCDCWGLCSLFYRYYLKKELPSYKIGAFEYDHVNKLMLSEIKTSKWQILDSPEPYSIALMRLGADSSVTVNHAGVVLEDGRLLQAYLGTGSIIVDPTSMLWKRIIRFYIKPS